MLKQSHVQISVIAPVYKCADVLFELTKRLSDSLAKFCNEYEIIYVNDGSPDNAWATIQELSSKDKHVKGIDLSRNFGQHHAITAGIDVACGKYTVIMDADLQDPPESIAMLYEKIKNGGDIVFANRINKQHGLIKKFSSILFYTIFGYLSGLKINPSVGNFSIISRSVLLNLRKFQEQTRGYPYIVKWLGYNTSYIDVYHGARANGKSSYNLHRLVKLALNNIIAYSNKPLILTIQVGFTLSFISMLITLILIIRYLLHGITVTGWTSLIVSVWFIGGLLLATIGMVGYYVGKTFDETKRRPLYLVRHTTNLETNPDD